MEDKTVPEKKTPTPDKTTAAKHGDQGRRYRGVSEEVRRAERRQRFIEAGLDVFGVRGYHSSTVRSICASAGLTERYFYESFENSEDLLCGVYVFCIQRLRERVLASLIGQQDDIEAMAKQALRAFFESLRDDPRIARLLFIEVLGVSERVDTMYRITVEDFANLLIRLSEPLVMGNLPAPLEAELVANGLLGSIIATASRWVLLGFNTPIDAMVINVHAIFVGVVRHLVQISEVAARTASASE